MAVLEANHRETCQNSVLLKRGRVGASVNVYLFLRQGDTLLCMKRQNTGYCDGYYGLISGHVENGESASMAMVREAYEEAGIHIDPEHLKMCHVMHRQTDRFNIDIFFECWQWTGEIVNAEPHKCSEILFVPTWALPTNTMDYVMHAFQSASQSIPYSEMGWTF
jgi:8-oxo-dGTP diphosphatase